MPDFAAIYVSADNRRVYSEPVAAPDIDTATQYAIANLEGPAFGAGSAWFVAAVVQEDHAELVAQSLEQLA